ncbi:MAG: RidA family protein [Candidatus Zixiibacteriota bacterium]|nr:MAG: RidA family protein [candidate division Zixibacteria bacterium]
MLRQNISSGSPYEERIGFSRAVRIGNMIAVSGTAPIDSNGATVYRGDLYNQTKYCLGIIEKAIKEAGGRMVDVIRTRVLLTDITNWREAGKAHAEYFSDIKPAISIYGVNKLIGDDWLVEVEAYCYVKE